jgi:hypothetical protein
MSNGVANVRKRIDGGGGGHQSWGKGWRDKRGREREKKKEKKIEGMREERAGSGGAPTRKEEGEFLVWDMGEHKTWREAGNEVTTTFTCSFTSGDCPS